MIYFIKYDEGHTFTGMNYPDGEYIFMTDANGSIAIVMRWIDQNIMSIEEFIPGLLQAFIYFCLGLGGMFMFMIMRTWGIKNWLALTLAPLIILLSPQMARFYAHLSLSYPMLVPMTFLWGLRKYKKPKLELVDGLFAVVLFFFFMNNAYVGFIMSMFAALLGFFVFIYRKQIGKGAITSSIIMMGLPVAITLIVYVLLKVNDPFEDRLEEQWGFFYYHTKWNSFFFPRWSLAASMMDKYAQNDWRSIEWANNLGIIPILLVLSLLIHKISRKFIKHVQPLLPKDIFLSVSLWAAFVMFLYAANTTIIPIQDWIESYMDVLLMFKSSGRFSWPMYFVVAVLAAKILQAWVERLNKKQANFGYFLAIPLLLFYSYETNFYLGQIFNGKDKPNYLTAPEIDKFKNDFAEAGINNDTYQALFTLPLLQGWNEKIMSDVYNPSERGSLILSSATGIPMINSRLSRNSTGATLRSVQVSGNPLLRKEILQELPNDKPILLVEGHDADRKMSLGEKHLRSLAKKIYTGDQFDIYELQLQDVLKYEELEATKTYISSNVDSLSSMNQSFLYYNSYDDNKNKEALFGDGCLTLENGRQTLIDTTITLPYDTVATIVMWNEITYEKYGMPVYFINVIPEKWDPTYHEFPSRENKDIYSNWIRSQYDFKVPVGKFQLKVEARVNQDINIDEMYLTLKNDTIYHKVDDSLWLINGYPVKLD